MEGEISRFRCRVGCSRTDIALFCALAQASDLMLLHNTLTQLCHTSYQRQIFGQQTSDLKSCEIQCGALRKRRELNVEFVADSSQTDRTVNLLAVAVCLASQTMRNKTSEHKLVSMTRYTRLAFWIRRRSSMAIPRLFVDLVVWFAHFAKTCNF